MAGPSPRPRLNLGRSSTIGLEFAATIGVLGWLGHRLDLAVLGGDAFPVFMLVGIFAGLVGGVLRMNRKLASPRSGPTSARPGAKPGAHHDRDHDPDSPA